MPIICTFHICKFIYLLKFVSNSKSNIHGTFGHLWACAAQQSESPSALVPSCRWIRRRQFRFWHREQEFFSLSFVLWFSRIYVFAGDFGVKNGPWRRDGVLSSASECKDSALRRLRPCQRSFIQEGVTALLAARSVSTNQQYVLNTEALIHRSTKQGRIATGWWKCDQRPIGA